MLLPHAKDPQMAEAALCDALPGGTRLLQGQYQIENALSDGGFGLTYVARDSLDRPVVIKECFPQGICQRHLGLDCVPVAGQERMFRGLLRSFLREAQLLARPDHPNIVAVHQVFRENGTAYIAMEHKPGHDLQTALDQAPEQFTTETLYAIARQALSALEYLHGVSILHRDVAPDNLLWSPSGELTLIDFGAALLLGAEQSRQDSATSAVAVKDGYSAPELYPASSAPGSDQMASQAISQLTPKEQNSIAWSCDLYSLGATLETLVTGEPPVPADVRMAAQAKGHADPRIRLRDQDWPQDRSLLAMIDTAMALAPQDRFACAGTWLSQLPAPSGQMCALTKAANQSPSLPPSAPSPAALDLDLQARIACLVAETNERLEPHLPRALRPAPPQPTAPSQPRVLVDIFGEPIADLDAWFRAQERAAKRNRSAPPPQEMPQEMPQAPSFQKRLDRLKDSSRR